LFQRQGYFQAQAVRLGVFECKVYHNILLNTKSQVDFDHLLQLHMVDKAEENRDMSWEKFKIVDFFEEKGDLNSPNHK
jgi:hypothetical protein